MKHTLAKRTLCLLFAGLLLLSSCGGGEGTPSAPNTDTTENTDTMAEETELTRENTPDNLPADLRFNGETVVFHVRGDEDCVREFQVEELTGEAVNDALYQRNITVSDRLNVNLDVAIGDGWEKYNNTVSAIRASIQSADGAYDIIAGWSARIPSLSLEGLFLDAQTIPYLDLEKPWWNQSCRTELTIGNRLFFVTGDITQKMIDPMYVYAFNQKVAEDLGIEDPYTVVNEGLWTIDYGRKQTSDVGSDLNGDGKMDENDFWGLTTFQNNAMDNYMQSTRVSLMSRDADGMPVLDVDMEHMTTLLEKVYALCFENPGCRVEEAGPKSGVAHTIFKEDRSLYTTLTMYDVRYTLADMESDFGILPYPKLNEEQPIYGTRVQDALTLFSVPIDCRNVDISGAVMEAVAAENYRKVTPTLYDVALKKKYSRDPESAAMIDLIQQSVLINFESIYNEAIGNPWFIMRIMMDKKTKDFASYWAKEEKKVEKALQKAVEQIREMDT